MPKSLKLKLEKIRNQKYKSKDFIIADAKDGDLAMGITTPGPLRDIQGKIGDIRGRIGVKEREHD